MQVGISRCRGFANTLAVDCCPLLVDRVGGHSDMVLPKLQTCGAVELRRDGLVIARDVVGVGSASEISTRPTVGRRKSCGCASESHVIGEDVGAGGKRKTTVSK